jgi:hypothetical protein
MNPDEVFFKWNKIECVATPVHAAAARCALVETLSFGALRQITSLSFSPRLQKSVINKAIKRLDEWPKDQDGNFILEENPHEITDDTR